VTAEGDERKLAAFSLSDASIRRFFPVSDKVSVGKMHVCAVATHRPASVS
jgi:hypothetical protein